MDQSVKIIDHNFTPYFLQRRMAIEEVEERLVEKAPGESGIYLTTFGRYSRDGDAMFGIFFYNKLKEVNDPKVTHLLENFRDSVNVAQVERCRATISEKYISKIRTYPKEDKTDIRFSDISSGNEVHYRFMHNNDVVKLRHGSVSSEDLSLIKGAHLHVGELFQFMPDRHEYDFPNAIPFITNKERWAVIGVDSNGETA